MLHSSNYDFSKALQSGATIFSLSQYRAISTLCWQSFSPSLADELQAKEVTSQLGTSQTGVASSKTMLGEGHRADFCKRMVSSLGNNTPILSNGVHSMPRLTIPLIDTVQKGGGAEKAHGVDCAQSTVSYREVYYPPH